ncbi:MAG: GNAT family N-acetyltransferase [Cypionkella sp.]|jgi:putative hemolysin|nr:GNAT family N-acetyltransferase [Cypionkella sp.]
MKPLSRGRYIARLAEAEADLVRAQRLRHLAFWAGRGRARADGRDADGHDALCRHVLIEDRVTGDLVACYRVQILAGAGLERSYAAQFYDLERLGRYPAPLLELGRFCLHPDRHDPDILRLAWALLTRMVDEAGVGMLFGCSSFPGAEPVRHAPALASLARHLAPPVWQPGPRAPDRISLAGLVPAPVAPDLPPLLRSYLAMGGWVSDHAVIDAQMDTLHVLTAVEIATIPPARARILRMIAADALG